MARAALEPGRIVMARKTSFYYSFLVLPADQRRAIIAVWDFFRAVDDAVDGAGGGAPRPPPPPPRGAGLGGGGGPLFRHGAAPPPAGRRRAQPGAPREPPRATAA